MLHIPPEIKNRLLIWVFVPYRIDETGSNSPFDIPTYRQQLASVFLELELAWKWQPITLENVSSVVEQVHSSCNQYVPVVLNLCDGCDELDGYPGLSVIDCLESKELFYTGADSKFYYSALSKIRMKEAFTSSNVKTSEYEVVSTLNQIPGICQRLPPPLIIKSSDYYAGAGLSKSSVACSDQEVQQQVELLLQDHECDFTLGNIYVERFISGREFTVFVLGSSAQPDTIKIYPPLELIFNSSIPDYEQLKSDLFFNDEFLEEYLSFSLVSDLLCDRLIQISKCAYCAVGGVSYGRVDIRMDQVSQELFVLEVNANCYISSQPISSKFENGKFDENQTSVGTILHLANISFAQLISEIIGEALTRKISNKEINKCSESIIHPYTHHRQDYKWLIPSCHDISSSPSEEILVWNKEHQSYSERVFSITQDPRICKKMIHPAEIHQKFCIPDSPEISILIPGCGSEIYLQKTILEYCPEIGEVYSTDFSDVAIEKSARTWQDLHSNIDYKHQYNFLKADSTQLIEQHPEWENKFDYVLVVNSVLSGEDIKNREMLQQFYQVLKPGGKLYGFFPTIFADLEISHLSMTNTDWFTDGSINLSQSAFHDKVHNDRQILYTPLRLNQIFKEIGFKKHIFEIVFFDSDLLIEDYQKIFEVDESGICQWEFLVRLEKPIN